jgi:hypothetical protein
VNGKKKVRAASWTISAKLFPSAESASLHGILGLIQGVSIILTPFYIYRVYQKSFNGFARLYLRNPLDYMNGMGAKRCVSALSFVWKFKNIDYLNCSMSYGRYTKRSFFAFFVPLKSSFVRI